MTPIQTYDEAILQLEHFESQISSLLNSGAIKAPKTQWDGTGDLELMIRNDARERGTNYGFSNESLPYLEGLAIGIVKAASTLNSEVDEYNKSFNDRFRETAFGGQSKGFKKWLFWSFKPYRKMVDDKLKEKTIPVMEEAFGRYRMERDRISGEAKQKLGGIYNK